jgi:hypothetical protein
MGEKLKVVGFAALSVVLILAAFAPEAAAQAGGESGQLINPPSAFGATAVQEQAASDFAVVEVIIDLEGQTISVTPDPVECYWKTGPDRIRWTFPDAPAEVASVVIEWKTDAMHRGMGFAPSTVGSHLPDLITTGMVTIKGRFAYSIYCYDAAGVLLAEVDPWGDGDEKP